MKILFIGDIFGSAGRKAIAGVLPRVLEEESPDFVVANCENAAGGAGMTRRIYDELLAVGIDVLTSGNHIWNRRGIESILNASGSRLIRPANYPPGTPGKGWAVIEGGNGYRLGVTNLLGRVNLLNVDCPFRCVDTILDRMAGETDAVLVDFHAETTSEKVAMGWYLDGRVSAVVGTHTHVPTDDGRILPQGTAYITDAGMTGAMDSVIGLETSRVLARFTGAMPVKFEQARDNPGMDFVLIELERSGATSIGHRRRYLEE